MRLTFAVKSKTCSALFSGQMATTTTGKQLFVFYSIIPPLFHLTNSANQLLAPNTCQLNTANAAASCSNWRGINLLISSDTFNP